MLRGRGGCYKHAFYGIESHRCMEATPSLACANKCVFCWRHHTNPGAPLPLPSITLHSFAGRGIINTTIQKSTCCGPYSGKASYADHCRLQFFLPRPVKSTFEIYWEQSSNKARFRYSCW